MPENRRQRTVTCLPVYSLLLLVNEIPVNYVATHEIDERPVHELKKGGWLSPHLVNVGRQTKCGVLIRHQLFERVPIAWAQSRKVGCYWLYEVKEGSDGPFVRSKPMVMELANKTKFDASAGTVPLKSSMIIFRDTLIKDQRGRHTRALDLYVISVAFGMHSDHKISQVRCIRHMAKR